MASPMPVPARIRFDAFELDATSGELRKAGVLLKLQPQPFRVLLLLIEHAGQVVTREEIERCLWSDSQIFPEVFAVNGGRNIRSVREFALRAFAALQARTITTNAQARGACWRTFANPR
jgi:DNA-binding winged helix-turn-helix (wHTH) protein